MDLRIQSNERQFWDSLREMQYDKMRLGDENERNTEPELNFTDEPVRIEVQVDHTLYGIPSEDCGDYSNGIAKRKGRSKCNCFECNPDGDAPPNANMFQCEICNKCFTRCKYYRRHKGLHNKTKSYKCDLCQISFMFSYQLQAHRLTHTHGQKPFQCNICRKAFTSKYYLKQHEWVHNPVTPFKCTICGKGYSSEGYFKRHELSHSQL